MQQENELKKKVKKEILVEEEFKACNVPDDFIVPETTKLEQDGDDAHTLLIHWR
jgi:hypothetical protein